MRDSGRPDRESDESAIVCEVRSKCFPSTNPNSVANISGIGRPLATHDRFRFPYDLGDRLRGLRNVLHLRLDHVVDLQYGKSRHWDNISITASSPTGSSMLSGRQSNRSFP